MTIVTPRSTNGCSSKATLRPLGITFHAQKELGDIVYVDLPKVGARVEQGKPLGTVESVKAVSEVFSPVSGEVIAINETAGQRAGEVE